MRYVIVVYEFEDGPMKQVRTYQQDALTPEDAVMQQGEALAEIERS
jgi:hypothetical protein